MLKTALCIFALLYGAAQAQTYQGDPCTGQYPSGANCYSGAVTWLKSANQGAPSCLLFELDSDPFKHFAIPDTALDINRIWDLLRQARMTGDEIGVYANPMTTVSCEDKQYVLGWGVWVGVRAYQ